MDQLRGRARDALDRIRAHAEQMGTDKMTMDEIDAEIAAARRERGIRDEQDR